MVDARAVVGDPATVWMDQGSGFVARDLDPWAWSKGIALDFSRPGKPTDNSLFEAFKGKFRVALNPLSHKPWAVHGETRHGSHFSDD